MTDLHHSKMRRVLLATAAVALHEAAVNKTFKAYVDEGMCNITSTETEFKMKESGLNIDAPEFTPVSLMRAGSSGDYGKCRSNAPD